MRDQSRLYAASRGRFSLGKILVFLFLSSAFLARGQDRYESGELKGFTLFPDEHIIDRLDDAITVREVRGTATIEMEPDSPMEGVLFELRGPGDSETIRSARTDSTGKFSLKHVRPGKYLFKASSQGYQSIVGILIVSARSGTEHSIALHMKPGV
jgi:hypothetical protein